MELINKYLNRISLTSKIMIIFLGCVILPMLLQNIFYFSETEANIQREISEKMAGTLNDIGNKVDAGVSDAISMTVRYHNDARIYECLDKTYGSNMEYLVDYQESVQQIVKNDLPFHLQIDEITFYTDNPSIFNGALVRKLEPFDTATLGDNPDKWHITALGDNATALAFRVATEYVLHERSERRFIALTRSMGYYREYSRYNKSLRLDLNPSYFNSLLSDTSLFSNLVIADDRGRILFCSNTYNQSGAFDLFDRDSLPQGMIVMERPINGLPLTLYGYYDTNIISGQFRKSVAGVVAISLAGLVIAVVFIFVVGNNISKRTGQIVKKSKQIARGDFTDDVIRLESEGDDEIASIEKSINQMSGQLRSYIDREYNAKLIQSRLEKETTEAKLMALQSQVNPHFLFNALESIRLNALDSDRVETARMIRHMSKMFRYLVDWDGDIIRLEQELNFLDEFLRIQKYRFGEEFSYSIKVEEEANNCLLPKLILQPLVENACVHGVEATSDKKEIDIAVSIRENMLVLRVEDNGGGISLPRLEALRGMLEGGERVCGSVGIYNVYQRLRLHYSASYRFEIDSAAGVGTVCTVSIPYRQEPDTTKAR